MDQLINIKINNLSGGYTNNPLFKNLKTELYKNKLTAIVGPNGSGKSTLIKYLIKELKTEDNKVLIEENDINKLSQLELANIISLVPQNSKQEYEFTVQELVAMGRYSHKDIETSDKVNYAIKMVHIEKIKNKLITEISGGEFQLAMLARAICQDTKIMILDEPINNLDPKHQIHVMELLSKLIKQNYTIICVMHDLNLVLRYFDYTIMLKKGRIYAEGNTKEVITEKNVKDVFDINSKIIHSHDQLPSTIYYSL